MSNQIAIHRSEIKTSSVNKYHMHCLRCYILFDRWIGRVGRQRVRGQQQIITIDRAGRATDRVSDCQTDRISVVRRRVHIFSSKHTRVIWVLSRLQLSLPYKYVLVWSVLCTKTRFQLYIDFYFYFAESMLGPTDTFVLIITINIIYGNIMPI